MQKNIILLSFLIGFMMVIPLAFAEESPREQVENGVKPFDIVCNQGFTQVFKITTSNTSCVNPDSIEKLVERGWGMYYSTRAYYDDGKIISESVHHWGQLFKFEMQRQNIQYTELDGFENHRITMEQTLTPFRVCVTLVGEDDNRFYPNFIVNQSDPFLAEKVEFRKIQLKDCEKMLYSVG